MSGSSCHSSADVFARFAMKSRSPDSSAASDLPNSSYCCLFMDSLFSSQESVSMSQRMLDEILCDVRFRHLGRKPTAHVLFQSNAVHIVIQRFLQRDA